MSSGHTAIANEVRQSEAASRAAATGRRNVLLWYGSSPPGPLYPAIFEAGQWMSIHSYECPDAPMSVIRMSGYVDDDHDPMPTYHVSRKPPTSPMGTS